jgi:exopolyphosphatase / guanosine-5'-triphosphate,3'-diphosphate pyrophosphatase
MNRAVIDVGTNSVKLLVATVDKNGVTPLLEKSDQTRLGVGFYSDHRLLPDAIKRTAEAVARFAGQARSLGVESVRVIATSAARDALNQDELASAIETHSGVAMQVISGEQEADWVFAGVSTDPRFQTGPLLILDVGGGSTEIVFGENGATHFRESFPLGTVRLFERFPVSDPPSERECNECQSWVSSFIEANVRPALSPQLESRPRATRLIGTGGTTTILAGMKLALPAFDRQSLESVRLTDKDVWQWHARLWSAPLSLRQQIPGLPPNRADVILMGTTIFAEIMRQFEFHELWPSTRGLRFAALLKD